jgi:hypothetical protein
MNNRLIQTLLEYRKSINNKITLFLNIFQIHTKPIVIRQVNELDSFCTSITVALLIGLLTAYIIFLVGPSQVPTLSYSISIRDSIPENRLCGAQIGYYDKLFTTTSIGVSYETSKPRPQILVAYNYEPVRKSGLQSDIVPCQCNNLLKSQGT